MADSNITKKALANALKELMEEAPFDKINVAQICEKCHMNRKSFYYHFKDKYDLINWIYDTEFIMLSERKNYADVFVFFEELCQYLYANRSFYRRALKIKGQNSFSDHFTERLHPIIVEELKPIFGVDTRDFHVLFFSDAFVSIIRRWIIELDEMDADEFFRMVRSIIQQTAEMVYLDTKRSE